MQAQLAVPSEARMWRSTKERLSERIRRPVFWPRLRCSPSNWYCLLTRPQISPDTRRMYVYGNGSDPTAFEGTDRFESILGCQFEVTPFFEI